MSDAKELRAAIRDCEFYLDGTNYKINIDSIHKVVEAAKRDLATLPREVEIERWVAIDSAGNILVNNFESEADLLAYNKRCWRDNVTPVRLSGKALLPGSKE